MGPAEKYVINEPEHYLWFTFSFTQDFILKLAMNILPKLCAYFFVHCSGKSLKKPLVIKHKIIMQ